jgi:hypothetical protein
LRRARHHPAVVADVHPARVDRALRADAFELGVEGVGSLLGGVGQTPGGAHQPDADAAVMAASRPLRLPTGHGAPVRSGHQDVHLPGIVASAVSDNQPTSPTCRSMALSWRGDRPHHGSAHSLST